MKKGILLGLLILGVVLIFAMVAIELLLVNPLNNKQQMPTSLSALIQLEPTPTFTPEPTPLGGHPDELVGEYNCMGHEYTLGAYWGQIFLKKNGKIKTKYGSSSSDSGEWRYDENSYLIIYSPDTFFLDYGEVDWTKKELWISFHPWATKYMAHAEGGRMTCSPKRDSGEIP